MSNRQAAIGIIKQLRGQGNQGLLAGGCVRDMLLSRTARDYDVATDAPPGKIIKLFKRTLKVGARFGVVIVMVGDEQVEVATFRTEGGYADGRHPDHVEFSNAEQDAQRRDFTVNGMFYDPLEKKVIDYVGGRADLDKGILRTIGDPALRFGEDYLRMLRAVRFGVQLGFEIAPATWDAVCRYADRITKISGERIAMELEATLTNPARSHGAQMLLDSGLAGAVFPSVGNERACQGVRVLEYLPKKVDFPLAVAGFFADCDTKAAINACAILKLSGAHIKHLRFLLANRGVLLDADMSLAKLKTMLASPYFQDMYELQRAIQRASGSSAGALLRIKRRTHALAGSELQPKPMLDGHELIAMGVTPGPMVGLVARQMYIEQLSEHLHDAEQTRQWVKRWLKNHRQFDR